MSPSKLAIQRIREFTATIDDRVIVDDIISLCDGFEGSEATNQRLRASLSELYCAQTDLTSAIDELEQLEKLS